jgi:hypothetical protein
MLPGQSGGYYLLVDPRLYPREHLPHFALYPPVYYSLPVARSYGYSPFAYPPGYTTPPVECPAAAPVTIPNPFVPQKKPSEPAKREKVTQSPVRVVNPFVSEIPMDFPGENANLPARQDGGRAFAGKEPVGWRGQ